MFFFSIPFLLNTKCVRPYHINVSVSLVSTIRDYHAIIQMQLQVKIVLSDDTRAKFKGLLVFLVTSKLYRLTVKSN